MKKLGAISLRRLILFAAIFLAFLLILSLMIFSNYPTIKRKISPEVINSWRKDINNLGAQEAFRKFKAEYVQSNRMGAHFAYHIFGKLLYEKLGATAIAFCDTSLQYGCFHGVFAKAISEKGINMIYELDEICINKFSTQDLECKHGIGHGLMEYYGPKRVEFALERCDNLKIPDRIGGCSSGVLMEYYFPVVIIEDTAVSTRRAYDLKNPDYPCNILNTKFRSVCYFELGKFWYSVFYQDLAKADQICSNTKNPELNKYCFLGIGNRIVAESKKGLEETKKKCSEMVGIDSQIYCRFGGSLGFAIESGEVRENRIKRFCEGLAEPYLQKCVDLKNMDMRVI